MQDKHPDDHDRGCEGRCYTCTCGYDDRVEAALTTLRQRAEQAEAECLEQSRIIGASGERELALRAKIEQAEAEVARLTAYADVVDEDRGHWRDECLTLNAKIAAMQAAMAEAASICDKTAGYANAKAAIRDLFAPFLPQPEEQGRD